MKAKLEYKKYKKKFWTMQTKKNTVNFGQCVVSRLCWQEQKQASKIALMWLERVDLDSHVSIRWIYKTNHMNVTHITWSTHDTKSRIYHMTLLKYELIVN